MPAVRTLVAASMQFDLRLQPKEVLLSTPYSAQPSASQDARQKTVKEGRELSESIWGTMTHIVCRMPAGGTCRR